jgi:hypothetical protein
MCGPASADSSIDLTRSAFVVEHYTRYHCARGTVLVDNGACG